MVLSERKKDLEKLRDLLLKKSYEKKKVIFMWIVDKSPFMASVQYW